MTGRFSMGDRQIVTLIRLDNLLIYKEVVVKIGWAEGLTTKSLTSIIIKLNETPLRDLKKEDLIVETYLLDFRVISVQRLRRRVIKYTEFTNPQFLKFESYRCP